MFLAPTRLRFVQMAFDQCLFLADEDSPESFSRSPRIQKIEILPEQALLQPGASQQLLVRATFSDGHTEDVTHWAKFNAANASVALDTHARLELGIDPDASGSAYCTV